MKVNKGTGVHELGLGDSRDHAHAREEGDPRLDAGIQARIGDQLRAMYSELMDQPVPDRFRDLLARLDEENESTENSR